MRLLVAALSFFISFFLLTSACIALLPADAPQWQTNAGIFLGFILSLFITNKLANVQGTNFWSLRRAPEPSEQPQQRDGLLVSTTYRATRYFEVEESHEEGPHYFIELHDESVLYMNGRYLSAFGPSTFLHLISYPRKFPCTEFVVIRDRYENNVADIRCGGSVLEPELVAPPFEERDLQGVMTLKDGEIITSRSYEEMKAGSSGLKGEV